MASEHAGAPERRVRAIADDLLAGAGLPSLTAFTLAGPRPLLDTPLPLTDIASAFQLAVAHATALVAEGTPRAHYEVSPAQALAGLEPTHFQRIHDHRFPQSSHGKELKSGFYPTADGRWFLPSGSYPHLRDGTLALLDCANTAPALAAAIRRWPAQELEDTVTGQGLPGAWARTPEAWLASDAGAAIASAPLLTVRPLRAGAPAVGGLAGLRVLDLSHVIAGPVVARHFAFLGGDVLRISSPAQPDPLPQILDTGIGKRNAFADFNDPDDLARVRALATDADIVVDSWRPGALARFGLDTAGLLPRAGRDFVHVSVSAYGHDGPWGTRKAFDQVVQAATGIAALHAREGKPRLSPTRLLTDYLTGQLGILGTLAALRQRQQSGGSWEVRVSLARVATYLLAWADPSHQGGDSFDALAPWLVTRHGPFGTTHHVAPAVAGLDDGTTPGPRPLGSSPAAWAHSPLRP